MRYSHLSNGETEFLCQLIYSKWHNEKWSLISQPFFLPNYETIRSSPTFHQLFFRMISIKCIHNFERFLPKYIYLHKIVSELEFTFKRCVSGQDLFLEILIWTIFKVFALEFVSILLLFYVSVFWLQGM